MAPINCPRKAWRELCALERRRWCGGDGYPSLRCLGRFCGRAPTGVALAMAKHHALLGRATGLLVAGSRGWTGLKGGSGPGPSSTANQEVLRLAAAPVPGAA